MKNILGAFADGAVLFPLLALLSLKIGFVAPVLLLSVGCLYIVSGFLFRIPMAVQPLKSVAVTALALGATITEVRLSGAVLGFFCMTVAFLPVTKAAKMIPSSLIQSLQFALGILLILQGIKLLQKYEIVTTVVFLGAVVVLCALQSYRSWPLLGFFASVGFLWAVFHPQSMPPVLPQEELRWSVILSLVAPQLALTLTNSVLGTYDVCKKYFHEKANRVTYRRLLSSIGVGNIVMAFVGGLPFCHGAGGVTAHVKGGATHWSSNLIIGGTLVGLSVYQWWQGAFVLALPSLLIAGLLMATGYFHLGLARETYQQRTGFVKILCATLTILVTQNLLWVLIVNGFLEGALVFIQNQQKEKAV